MTATHEGTGLVRVSVVRGTRRSDLAVPGAVPVADLLPELVAAVGALDPYTVHGGYRLVRSDGVLLRPDQGLVAQGVEDGHVLTVDVGADDVAPKVYDDVVEAVADSIERQTRPWSDASSRRTALGVASLVLLVGAAALAALRAEGLPVALAALVLSVLLLTAGAVLERGQKAHEPAVVALWGAVVLAGVCGLALGSLAEVATLSLAALGVMVLVVSGVGMLALAADRAVLLPGVVLGAVLAAVGALTSTTGVGLSESAAVVAAVAVVAGSVVPWAAMGTTSLQVPQPRSDAEIVADPAPLDGAAVDRQVRMGRTVLVSLTVTVALVLAACTWLLVGLGLFGFLVVVVSAVALALRTRQYRDSLEVLVGFGGATLALLVATVSAVALHPGWRVPLAAVLVVTAAVLLVVASLPRTPSVRVARLGDLVEGFALVSLLPLVVAALGFFPGT